MLHELKASSVSDRIQNLIARVIAENPAGRGLCLIGGFRFRLLDHSPRRSVDIDYHWIGDPGEKAVELTALFNRKVLPEARRTLGYDGSVGADGGPGGESPFVKTIELAFYRTGQAGSRIEIPVEITRIPCLDPPLVRTLPGTVYLTVSNQDMAESKVIALLNRMYVQERDFLDLFLFQDHLAPDAAGRMAKKLSLMTFPAADINTRIAKLRSSRDIHIRNIEAIIRSQVESETAERLMAGGGGAAVFDQVMTILEQKLNPAKDPAP